MAAAAPPTDLGHSVTLKSSDGVEAAYHIWQAQAVRRKSQAARSVLEANHADSPPLAIKAVKNSTLIRNLLKDLFDDEDAIPPEAIPIPNVNDQVLKKVMEWCSQHPVKDGATDNDRRDDDLDSRKKSTEIDEWDQKFMQVDQEMLFEIILAANYLDIKALLDIGCKTVANMIKGKSPEEIRKTFNITNDFTPEEEDQIRRENEWAEDR